MKLVSQNVTLVDFYGRHVAAAAARRCRQDGGIEEIMTPLLENAKMGKDQALVRRVVMDYGHESIAEHILFTFHIEGISRACSHQLVRSRIGVSFAQQSQRAVQLDNIGFIVPPTFKRTTGYPVGNPVKQTLTLTPVDFMQLCEQYYMQLVADGIPAEDARYILPAAAETKLIVTCNARALLHFFEERLCSKAQWEIRELAKNMWFLAQSVCPELFSPERPKCIKLGRCPEQDSCGFFETFQKGGDLHGQSFDGGQA